MEIVENVALITINATLFAQMASFLVFLFLINRLMFRPLRQVMREREDRVEQAMSEIRGAGEEMDGLARELSAIEAEARAEAFALKEKLDQEGNREAEAILARSRAKIEEVRRETQQRVRVQVAEARESLASEARVLSVAVMEKVLGRNLA